MYAPTLGKDSCHVLQQSLRSPSTLTISAIRQAFDSLGYPPLAVLGISVDWNDRFLLKPEGGYKPRFKVR